jgi:hypothetical protein
LHFRILTGYAGLCRRQCPLCLPVARAFQPEPPSTMTNHAARILPWSCPNTRHHPAFPFASSREPILLCDSSVNIEANPGRKKRSETSNLRPRPVHCRLRPIIRVHSWFTPHKNSCLLTAFHVASPQHACTTHTRHPPFVAEHCESETASCPRCRSSISVGFPA